MLLSKTQTTTMVVKKLLMRFWQENLSRGYNHYIHEENINTIPWIFYDYVDFAQLNLRVRIDKLSTYYSETMMSDCGSVGHCEVLLCAGGWHRQCILHAMGYYSIVIIGSILFKKQILTTCTLFEFGIYFFGIEKIRFRKNYYDSCSKLVLQHEPRVGFENRGIWLARHTITKR